MQIEGRPADHLEDVGGRGLLLQGFTQLIEQARVLDGDDGLGGEVLHQLDLLVVEFPNFLTVNENCPDDLAIPEHRHAERRTGTRQLGQASIAVSLISLNVG